MSSVYIDISFAVTPLPPKFRCEEIIFYFVERV